MDRSAWLKEQRRVKEEQDDSIYAPIYDEHWGEIGDTHRDCLTRFLDLCPPSAHILDAPCGTGKYWPLILSSGRTVHGIDQSAGMLAQARKKHPDVPATKLGLQEMEYRSAYDGAICVDALEMIPPEDWPLVLGNLHRALKAGGPLYLTVEIQDEAEIAKAFDDARAAGLPVVYGEWAYEGGDHGDWAQDGGYHFYPRRDQVIGWLAEAGFQLLSEAEDEVYHHYLVRKSG
jgi:SAM-dependent methyltransferase